MAVLGSLKNWSSWLTSAVCAMQASSCSDTSEAMASGSSSMRGVSAPGGAWFSDDVVGGAVGGEVGSDVGEVDGACV